MLRPFLVAIFLVVASSWLAIGQPQSATPPSAARALANNDAIYVKLRNIHVGTQAVHVSNFTMKRDAGTFLFKTGTFYLLEPVNDKVTGAVFLGDGTFKLDPPIEVEKRNLLILTKGEPFQEQFSSAVFRFTDQSDDEIRKGAVNETAPASGDPNGVLSDVKAQLKNHLRENLDVRLLQDVLSSQPGGEFVGFIKGKKYSDKMIYEIDPHGVVSYFPDPGPIFRGGPVIQEAFSLKPEEVALTTWDYNHYGIWAAFHFSKEYAAGTANSDEQNGAFAIDHQKLDTSINKAARLSGTAETTVVALQDGVRVLELNLFPTLRVATVTGQDHQPLAFIQEAHDEDADFAVILPHELKKGDSYVITTKYEGKDAITSKGGGNYYPIARQDWYPSLGFGRYSLYELTFSIPKGMKMAATGRRLKDIDEGSENITKWVSDVPQAVAGFNFGRFKREEGKPLKQTYLLETYANPEPPDMVRDIQLAVEGGAGVEGHPVEGTASLGSMSTLALMKKAMAEGQIAIDLYTDYFGEAPYKSLAMTQQTAANFGQSWPGLVYLPITYFFDSTVRHHLGMDDPRGYFKVVGPHEIAHQWWGHMVGFNSYRDQWMSEGFAEMSASIFLQYVYNQHGLDDYHKFWADERWLMTSPTRTGRRPIEVGPVTLGYRLDTAKTGNVTRGLIYPKGAYILQMVRFMLAQRTGDPDARFKAMMHEFTKTYANRQASTEDFKAVLEKYMTPDMDLAGNHKMDWFFNEYVYGTDYPTYKFEHSFSNDANGDVVLNFTITQANVGKGFAMPVPVYVEFNNGRVARLGAARLIGNTSLEQHVPLKGLKEKPKRAMLAYYDDVLGSIENK